MPDPRMSIPVDLKRIAQLPDLNLNDQHQNMALVSAYLKRFGYLDPGTPDAQALDASISDGLRKVQRQFGLPVTGTLDAATRQVMATDRCGMPDPGGPLDFATLCAWNRRNLTCAFGPLSAQVGNNVAMAALRRAFATWANCGVGLTFTEVATNASPDILIEWRQANDPDHSMVGGVLAHADFPPGCSVVVNNPPLPLHYDDQEHTWVDGAVANGFDIETVGLHEIGHLLGLGHTTVAGSVMFPTVSRNFTLRALQQDDLDGIRALYPVLPTGPVAQGDDMQPGEVLNPGQSITSPSGRYRFIYQGDGNLVLYDGGTPLWASGTDGRPVGVCIMQGDGNLVIYVPGGQPIWSSDTWQHPSSRLVVQDDGNVVIYRPDGTPVWATNTWLPMGPTAQGDDMQPGEVLNPGQSITSPSGRYRFIYQGDGNLVLYDGGTPLWASGTDGRPVGVCIMQGDGNLVIYVPGGQPIWSSDTWQHPSSRLVVQDDGNVVIYRPDGTPVWATNTVQS